MREESLAVREKAVALAEKNAAALGSVSSNIKQAQAISKRQGLARRQVVINGDPIDARNLLHTPPAQAEESNDSDFSLPPLDSSVRSYVVGEKGSGQPATDGSRRLPSVVVAATVSGSPMNQPQPQQPVQLQSQQLFSVGAAQNIVSAVLQMGFTLQDQDTFTAVLVEKVTLLFCELASNVISNSCASQHFVVQVCALLQRRSGDAGSRDPFSSSKFFVGSDRQTSMDVHLVKSLQRERADLEARERALVKREQLLLTQAKEISERSRVLAQAEADAKEHRMKGLVAAERLGRAHVQEVAAASTKLNSLADDVRGTNDALMALLSGVQALTDVENGIRFGRETAQFDADMQELDEHARDLEIRGNQHITNFMSIDSPATPAPKHTSVAAAADWRASPAASQLDDEQAALWDRLTNEQLEVLQGLYHTHSKVQLSSNH